MPKKPTPKRKPTRAAMSTVRERTKGNPKSKVGARAATANKKAIKKAKKMGY